MATQGKPMTMSGYCMFPAVWMNKEVSHQYCTYEGCTCWCHKSEEKS